MDETTKLLIILGVIALSAVLLGSRVAREANEREAVIGGRLARLFNLIGSMAFAGLVPGVLTGIILGAVHVALPIALGLLATCFLSMLLFAILELPARKQLVPIKPEDEDLWTAEKARSSGL